MERRRSEGVADLRVTYQKHGGLAYFPRLARPVVIDARDLDPEKARELEHLLEEAGFFNLSATRDHAARPDAFHYSVKVEQPGRAHAIERTDPIGDAALAKLIAFLDRLARHHP